MSDIVARLLDLHEQATKERSHFYVGSCCRDAITRIAELEAENVRLREQLAEADAVIHHTEGGLCRHEICPHEHAMEEAIARHEARLVKEPRL